VLLGLRTQLVEEEHHVLNRGLVSKPVLEAEPGDLLENLQEAFEKNLAQVG